MRRKFATLPSVPITPRYPFALTTCSRSSRHHCYAPLAPGVGVPLCIAIYASNSTRARYFNKIPGTQQADEQAAVRGSPLEGHDKIKNAPQGQLYAKPLFPTPHLHPTISLGRLYDIPDSIFALPPSHPQDTGSQSPNLPRATRMQRHYQRHYQRYCRRKNKKGKKRAHEQRENYIGRKRSKVVFSRVYILWRTRVPNLIAFDHTRVRTRVPPEHVPGCPQSMYPGIPRVCTRVPPEYVPGYPPSMYLGAPRVCAQISPEYVPGHPPSMYPGAPRVCAQVSPEYVPGYPQSMYPSNPRVLPRVLTLPPEYLPYKTHPWGLPA